MTRRRRAGSTPAAADAARDASAKKTGLGAPRRRPSPPRPRRPRLVRRQARQVELKGSGRPRGVPPCLASKASPSEPRTAPPEFGATASAASSPARRAPAPAPRRRPRQCHSTRRSSRHARRHEGGTPRGRAAAARLGRGSSAGGRRRAGARRGRGDRGLGRAAAGGRGGRAPPAAGAAAGRGGRAPRSRARRAGVAAALAFPMTVARLRVAWSRPGHGRGAVGAGRARAPPRGASFAALGVSRARSSWPAQCPPSASPPELRSPRCRGDERVRQAPRASSRAILGPSRDFGPSHLKRRAAADARSPLPPIAALATLALARASPQASRRVAKAPERRAHAERADPQLFFAPVAQPPRARHASYRTADVARAGVKAPRLHRRAAGDELRPAAAGGAPQGRRRQTGGRSGRGLRRGRGRGRRGGHRRREGTVLLRRGAGQASSRFGSSNGAIVDDVAQLDARRSAQLERRGGGRHRIGGGGPRRDAPRAAPADLPSPPLARVLYKKTRRPRRRNGAIGESPPRRLPEERSPRQSPPRAMLAAAASAPRWGRPRGRCSTRFKIERAWHGAAAAISGGIWGTLCVGRHAPPRVAGRRDRRVRASWA